MMMMNDDDDGDDGDGDDSDDSDDSDNGIKWMNKRYESQKNNSR